MANKAETAKRRDLAPFLQNRKWGSFLTTKSTGKLTRGNTVREDTQGQVGKYVKTKQRKAE